MPALLLTYAKCIRINKRDLFISLGTLNHKVEFRNLTKLV